MKGTSNHVRRFDDRVALVTGAAGAIGAATARRIAEEGGSVILADVDREGVDRAAERLRAEGLCAVAARVDQGQPDDVERLFADVVASFDRLDVCFANAGVGGKTPFLDLPLADWRRFIDINLTGTFLVCQAAARRMIQCGNGGALVLTSSSGGMFPGALASAYCVAKAGVSMLARAVAPELGSYRIRINSILPGTIETGMMAKLLSFDRVRDAIESETPLGRIGTPEDVAAAVAFLSSDDAAYVTGTTLLIDGGQTVNGSPRWFSTDHRRKDHPVWELHTDRWIPRPDPTD